MERDFKNLRNTFVFWDVLGEAYCNMLPQLPAAAASPAVVLMPVAPAGFQRKRSVLLQLPAVKMDVDPQGNPGVSFVDMK